MGKLWPIHAKIGKNIPQEYFKAEFGVSHFHDGKTTLIMKCRKAHLIHHGKRCEFGGIYVKEDGCFYIRGKHEHALPDKVSKYL